MINNNSQKQKFRKLVMLIASCVLLLCINSCNKTWTCTFNYYYLECIKGTDTIYNRPTLIYSDTSQHGSIYDGAYYDLSSSYLESLVTYYKANGYTVIQHPISGGTVGYGVGQNLVKTYEANGWVCKTNGL